MTSGFFPERQIVLVEQSGVLDALSRRWSWVQIPSGTLAELPDGGRGVAGAHACLWSRKFWFESHRPPC